MTIFNSLVGRAFKFGITTLKKHWRLSFSFSAIIALPLVVFLPLLWAVGVIQNISWLNLIIIMKPLSKVSITVLTLLIIGIFLVETFLYINALKVGFRLHDSPDSTVTVYDVLSNITLNRGELIVIFRFVLSQILCMLILSLGFLLLIVPGLIILVRLSFIQYFIVDERIGVIESLKKGYKSTFDHSWELLIFNICTLLIYKFFGIFGILVQPLITLMYISIYRSLNTAGVCLEQRPL